jgi:hypothetical protein
MTQQNLTPETQAILNIIKEVSWNWSNMEPESPYTIAAAVLRAVADQVVPEERKPMYSDTWEESALNARLDVRNDILRIAHQICSK